MDSTTDVEALTGNFGFFFVARFRVQTMLKKQSRDGFWLSQQNCADLCCFRTYKRLPPFITLISEKFYLISILGSLQELMELV